MAPRIWTIGHSVHPLDVLIGLLQAHDIHTLADVRTFPGSRRLPWFNQEVFAPALVEEGIRYVHLPGLGGRRRPREDSPNTGWKHDSFRGYADHMDTPEFAEALQQLKEFALQDRTCILCAEALWWQCHRSLIADRLKAEGWRVTHILKGREEEHRYTAPAHVEDGRLSYAAAALF